MATNDDIMPPDEAQALMLRRLRSAVSGLSGAEQADALDWIDSAITSTDHTKLGVMELILNEKVRIVRMVNGEPSITLTEIGKSEIPDLIEKSPELRRLLAQETGRTVVDPPKRAQ